MADIKKHIKELELSSNSKFNANMIEHIKASSDKISKYQNNNNIYEELEQTNDINKIYVIISPIYYLFDGYINENIGSDSKIRNYINNVFNINTLFSINTYQLTDLPNPTHSTNLYKIVNKERTYMYYSNSGLGIESNQIYNTDDNFVVPKIYFIKKYI